MTKVKKALEESENKLKTWKKRCLDSEKKFKNKDKELKKENATLKKEVVDKKEAWAGLGADLVGLQKYIIIENTNDFNKAIRQIELLYQELSSKDARFDVNKDILDHQMMDVDNIMIVKTTMIEDATDETFDEETTEVSSSIVADP
ncbi:hypothetical protein LR48_Vigan11g041600 [Vigna angularis]|uniref:Uncharacterized protein n=1 Tax=Phaseolus angularis TaxID=3914 RepID=A0A0L9VQZ7_PHAAN|nr:uncharacterized protein HKW66_Vig0171980 [Vigna angularis]KOM57383.1 hypothetical protein LR48_Vigan11g041600 [Vigna angularis]